MRADEVYIDTSALAKWYVNEPHSSKFRDFVVKLDHAAISRLAVVELRRLLKKYGRAGEISAESVRKAYATFEQDIIRGH